MPFKKEPKCEITLKKTSKGVSVESKGNGTTVLDACMMMSFFMRFLIQNGFPAELLEGAAKMGTKEEIMSQFDNESQ